MARELRYQPIRPPQKIVTQEQMQAILERNAKKPHVEVKVEVPPAIPAARSGLVWRKVSAWCIESECGKFRIEKFVMDPSSFHKDTHIPAAIRYRCLIRRPEWFWHFDTTSCPQEARARCEGKLSG